jgi:hypothetical protein
VRSTRALYELLARSSGAAAATLAIPLYGGVALASAVIFGGNGMDTADLIRVERGSITTRLTLWLGWIVLTTPIARAFLTAPNAAWLRSLPIARARVVLPLCFGLVAFQLPWIILYGRGSGVLNGLGAGALGAAITASIASIGMLRYRALLAIPALVWVVLGLPLSFGALVAIPALTIAARDGFYRGVALTPPATRLVRGPAITALTGAFVVRLLRAERVALTRALLVAAAGGALAAVGARNNDRLDSSGFAFFTMAVASLPLVLASGVVAGPIARTEQALTWLLATTATPISKRVFARSLAAALIGSLTGVVIAVVAAALAKVGVLIALVATGTLALWGACIGSIASFVARRASRQGKREGGAAMAGLVVLAIGALLLGGFLDATALVLAPIAALITAFVDARDYARAHAL